MSFHENRFSTGLPSLDKVLRSVLPGDNVVLHVEKVEDYLLFAKPFYEESVRMGRRVIYFRFGTHAPLVPPGVGVEIHEFNPDMGFERFIFEIHKVIEDAGIGVCYVFDCLSTLAASWYSDRMLGNFFMLTCPYLFDLDTVAYFALLRNEHSFHATTPIAETTQILLDVFCTDGRVFVHPRKVQQRHSSTLYMLHEWRGEEFVPVPHSSTITEVLKDVNWSWQDMASYKRGFWSKTFNAAEKLWADFRDGHATREQVDEAIPLLLRMMISRNERVLKLAREYFDMGDLLWIRSRMLSTGLVGGKAVGMLLARAILKKRFGRHDMTMEDHDSFFVGTDLFCTYLVQDGCWWMKQRQKDDRMLLQGAEDARMRILTGYFPDHIKKRFQDMLNHFGQSPIIVRSSSLLEDNFGNAFAGKYDSVFLANQGTPEERVEAFIVAVKKIFASTLSKEALLYRKERGILNMDEQMGLLVQRVSGCNYGKYFYPHLAGVGLSFNPYVWHESIDPDSGMIRLVFGLGTRAVDRSDDDCTRIVALNAPMRRAEMVSGDPNRYAQRKVDVLDLGANYFCAKDFHSVTQESPELPYQWFSRKDRAVEELALQRGRTDLFPWAISFDRVIEDTNFISDMRQMLQILGEAYEYPVEIEFTANFLSENDYRVNLLQCRPLQVHHGQEVGDAPAQATPETVLMGCNGPVIGRSRDTEMSRIIYVVPSTYAPLDNSNRYKVAELIGRIVHLGAQKGKDFRQMLVGPGRWGTTTPALGVPVRFAQIKGVQVLCEVVAMSDSLVPDVSLGTHFFNELVECDMLYMAVFPSNDGVVWDREYFKQADNVLLSLIPEAEPFAHIIKVIDSTVEGHRFGYYANTLHQKALLYRK